MKTRSQVAVLVAALVVGGVTWAVLSFTADGDRPGRDGVLEIVVEDYELRPSAFTVPAEEPVTLVFVSRNEFTQNLSFGRSVIEDGGRPVGFAEDLLVDLEATVEPSSAWIDPTATIDAVTLSVKPGANVTVDVTFPAESAGVWQVGCYLGNSCDYQVGPAGELTIE